MKIYNSIYKDDRLVQSETVKEFDKSDSKMSKLINVYPEVEYTKFFGFGGAVTESSGYCYSLLDDEEKKKLIDCYYGEDGLGYLYARVSIDSCDFCLSNYCSKADEQSDFTLERDEKYILPLLREIEKTKKLTYLMSPWSPPAYMKDTKNRNKGGKLLRAYYGACAEHYCTYIQAYLDMGFDIRYMTMQNEPNSAQMWDSCQFTAEEEADFLSGYLYPEMKKRGLDQRIKRLVWDHNRVRVYERLRDIINRVEDEKAVDGVAYHWYSGDHFDQLRMVRERYPDKLSVFSEGCVEYSHYGKSQESEHAEKYAYNIINNLKNGCSLFFDWNILLDREGGPNHVGNLCAAPIMLDDNGKLCLHTSYYIIAHFSKHLKPGAVCIGTSSYSDRIEHVAFKNPDGQILVFLLNRSEEELPFNLRLNGEYTDLTLPSKSVSTIVI